MSWSEEIQSSLKVLKQGGILLYPSDTLWGIGCDATNKEAVQRLMKLKNRPEGKGLISLIDNENKLQRYVKEIPDAAYDILDASTNSLTLVYPDGLNIAESALNPDGSIALRIVKEGFAHDLIKKFNKAIISTSANLSGEPFSQKYEDINPAILDGLDYVVNLDPELSNKPSSILKLGLKGEIEIIRH